MTAVRWLQLCGTSCLCVQQQQLTSKQTNNKAAAATTAVSLISVCCCCCCFLVQVHQQLPARQGRLDQIPETAGTTPAAAAGWGCLREQWRCSSSCGRTGARCRSRGSECCWCWTPCSWPVPTSTPHAATADASLRHATAAAAGFQGALEPSLGA